MQRPEDDQRISRQKTETSAANFLPSKITYEALVKASEGCKGCELYKFATQTVFGEGATDASLILVGEQPGNEEDLAGHPFVGPAGKLLDKALAEAGIPRDEVYVTNAVKHFKFEERGKRRLHKQPSARNIKACRPWLEAEIELIKPEAVICLGSTAAKSLLGPSFALTKHLGEWQTGPGNIKILATYHPSAALRAPDHDQREALYKAIVSDLKKAAKLL
ncbi:MAG TPA: UdgX family uracil-DNA binding protein [Patescibacteria group bacterium]|jgi:DNA polymerase|nr:UdgX family uracil-DNA binding protein [Patescibacteria group bacterium]